jgi:hypothetical protein
MAAGLGFKDFVTGEVLTAADVDGYLMQGVWVFASATARDAAVTSPQEGNFAYLKDTNVTTYYTGSAWANLDTTGMTNPMTTTGDTIYSSSGSTPARLGIGSTGQVLTVAAGVPSWAAPAGGGVNKNYLINGGFNVAQRGTSFTSTGGANNNDAYTLDRWYILSDTNDVIDVSQDTTTVPTNGQFAIALDVETVNKKFGIATIIENKDCIGLIGNTITFSFKAKVSSTTKLDNVKAAIVAWSGTADSLTSDIISSWNVEGTNPTLIANSTYENSPTNLNLTTDYATYSVSALVDTASTKNLVLFVWSDVTDTTLGDFLYVSQAKLELGSAATAFEYAGGTTEGELAACQRYGYGLYQKSGVVQGAGTGFAYSSTGALIYLPLPVEMRAIPTVTYTTQNGMEIYDSAGTPLAITAMSGTTHSLSSLYLVMTVASGLTGGNGTASTIENGTAQILFANAEL